MPRFPDSGTGRPNSAPDGPRLRSKSFSRSSRGLNLAAALRPDNDFVQKQILPPVPAIPTQHRRRRSSLESDRTSRFVDILDAQGELKPSNFRSRLQAAGARDYGEDVAERNLGQNAHDLQSPAVKAFYAHSTAGSHRVVIEKPPREVARSPYSGTARQGNRLPTQGKRASSTSLAKVSETAWKTFSDFDDAEVVEQDDARGRRSERGQQKRADFRLANGLGIDERAIKADRRRSFHTLAASRSREKTKPRPLSLHKSFASFNEEMSLPPPIPSFYPVSSCSDSVHGIGRVEVESVVDETFDEPAPSPSRFIHQISPCQLLT